MFKLIRVVVVAAGALALLASASTGSAERGGASENGTGYASGSPRPECRMGSDGINACGYNCRMGSDGHFACADTPDGVCAMNSNGSVSCSHLSNASASSGGPAPECRMGSDGINTCGYNCRMGSNGHFYCASRPDGQCAFNSNGTFSCP